MQRKKNNDNSYQVHLKNQKAYLLCLCLIALIVGVVGMTLCYFMQQTPTVVNTFQLGDITYELKLNANPPSGYANTDVSMPNVSPDDNSKEGAQKTVAAGSVDFTLDKVPTLEGYTFGGWYAERSLNNKVCNATDKVITVGYNEQYTTTDGDNVQLVLYAKWTPNTYTVIYDENGGDNAIITGSTSNSTHVYDVEKNLTQNGYVRTGYTFIGWNTSPDGSGNSYEDEESVKNLTADADGTVTLYAQWGAKSYVIRYHGNGGTGEMADQVIKYDSPTVLTKNAFVKEDYSFYGWALSPTGDVKYIDEQTVVNLKETGTLDLYAIWVQDSHTVHFDYNGGYGSPESKQFLNGYAYGQLPEYPVHPVKKVSDTEVMSYLFTGWYTEPTGGTRVYASTIANRKDDHTLYAHWEEAPTNNVIQDIVVKNNPDDDGDGVVDDIYLNLKCTSTFEKFNIPLKNLIVGQKYKITYTASNDASFGDYYKGYSGSEYGSHVVATRELTGGLIKDDAGHDILATWNNRIEPDGNNDGSQAAINDSYLQGPWKNRTIEFTATAKTMYWAWDFGLMEDGILNNYNITDIKLEPVAPKIQFAQKDLKIYEKSKAKIASDNSSEYKSSFVFDGDSYAETMWYKITDLTPGATYTIKFNHKMSGGLINNDYYDYGCGISSVQPSAYNSRMNQIGATWISGTVVFTKLDTTENVTFTFTPDSNTAYWAWNLANCSDTTNCNIDVEIVEFSVKHKSGDSIKYYPKSN